MKILINTISTKKHSGGAFQISKNYLIKSLDHPEIEWYYFTSKDIDDDIGEMFTSFRNIRYFSFPTQPDFFGTYWKIKRMIQELEDIIKPDVIYSVSSPSYFTYKAPEVMRFTNPWVTHPNKYAWSVLSLKQKLFFYLYCLNQKKMMKAARYFITQTDTCAKGIRDITNLPINNIKVIPNVLPSVYTSINISPIVDNDYINIACVGAAHTHKNFDIIPCVIQEFHKNGINNIRFHVTLPIDEPILIDIKKKLLDNGLTIMLVNHGRLTQIELAILYRKCQFCFLPSLLEVFSASTIEAMYFNLPIVATDFKFNYDILEDSCLYYEPKNAKDAAQKLIRIITNSNLQHELKIKMQKRMALFSNYDNHFNEIKDFLVQVAEITKYNN